MTLFNVKTETLVVLLKLSNWRLAGNNETRGIFTYKGDNLKLFARRELELFGNLPLS